MRAFLCELFDDDSGKIVDDEGNEWIKKLSSFALPMDAHDEGCPQHGKNHECNGQLYLNFKE